MKILTMTWRWLTRRCVFCGSEKRPYSNKYYDIEYYCPTDLRFLQDVENICCSLSNKFITHKEGKVQRALGLFSGPKGF